MLIVDLSRVIAGAFCARLLSQRGDNVVAVGELLNLDSSTSHSNGGGEWAKAYLRSGVETFTGSAKALSELIGRADVLLTGWEAGRPTHQLDVRSLNPLAVEVVVGSFGSDGPYAHYRGSPLIDWASGGYLYMTGLPEREPLMGPQNLPAFVAGYLAASAVEVGICMRQRGEISPRIDVSTMEAMASSHMSSFSGFAGNGKIHTRLPHPQSIHPLDIIRCDDGWVSLAVVTDAQYDALVGVIGDPNLVIDPRFLTGQSRREHADAFDDLVGDWFLARTAEDVVDILQKHSVPAIKMVDELSVVDDPQLRHRKYWQEWTDGSKTGVMPGDPIRVEAPAATVSAPRQPRAEVESPLPLTGTLVVEFTDFWAGPLTTRMLADLGATVIRVERPGARFHIDPAGPFADWKKQRGKYSIAMDVKSDDGRNVLSDLLQSADVFVENFRPGVLERLGFSYPDISAGNPRIVYVSLSGFGQDGPRAAWASFGPILEAASSIQARTRYPDSIPLLLGDSLPDIVGGFAGLFATLNRLRHREATDLGAWVDISQLEAYTAIAGEEILRASVTGTTWQGTNMTGRVFECRGDDAWVAVDAVTDAELTIVSKALGCNDSIDARAAAFAQHDKWEVTTLLQAQNIPAFPVVDVSDLVTDPHLRERGYLVDVDQHDKSGTMMSLPFHSTANVAHIAPTAPWSGQHSAQVLRTVLGYSERQIADLLARGSVVQS